MSWNRRTRTAIAVTAAAASLLLPVRPAGAAPAKVGVGLACDAGKWGARDAAGLVCARLGAGKHVWVELPQSALAATSASTPTTKPATGGKPGSIGSPFPIGKPADVDEYERKWRIAVTKVNFNANKVIAATNSLNDRPKPGKVYVMVTTNITFLGPLAVRETGPFFAAIDSANIEFETASVVTPNASSKVTAYEKGVQHTVDIAIEVETSRVDSLRLVNSVLDNSHYFALR